MVWASTCVASVINLAWYAGPRSAVTARLQHQRKGAATSTRERCVHLLADHMYKNQINTIHSKSKSRSLACCLTPPTRVAFRLYFYRAFKDNPKSPKNCAESPDSGRMGVRCADDFFPVLLGPTLISLAGSALRHREVADCPEVADTVDARTGQLTSTVGRSTLLP